MPRELSFSSYDEMLKELDRLERGYTPAGNWNLGQTCNHLNYFIVGSMDGHQFKTPWLLKVLFGRYVLNRILSGRKMKSGIFTPQKPLPTPDIDQVAAVQQFRQSIQRVRSFSGSFHPSPFFGVMTPEQCHELNLIHCAHHFGYLEPKG